MWIESVTVWADPGLGVVTDTDGCGAWPGVQVDVDGISDWLGWCWLRRCRMSLHRGIWQKQRVPAMQGELLLPLMLQAGAA
jgi:hypothetical protein